MTNKQKENKQNQVEAKEVKRIKLTLPAIAEMFDLTKEEIEHAKDKLAIGETLGNIKKYFFKERKEAQKEKERKEAKAKEEKEIAKKAIELAKEAKDLYNELLNVPDFKDFSKVYLTIKNTSQYTSYKGKTWKVYGKRKIQDIEYIVTEEFEKADEKGIVLFDMPCYIPVSDITLDYNRVMIRSYERSKQGGYNEIMMKYEKVK